MELSEKFYTKLGIEGLSNRKEETRTLRELVYLKTLFNKKQKILDLACGYGRLTIPLAKQGYSIQGIDITPLLIKQARKNAKKEKLKIDFRLGDMRKLPYSNSSFDVIICMWSSFIELRSKKDQLKMIREALRVLKNKGFVLIELPIPFKIKRPAQLMKLSNGDEFVLRKNTRLVRGKLCGINHITYRYDKKSLINLMKETKIKYYKMFTGKFGFRNRFILQFWKE